MNDKLSRALLGYSTVAWLCNYCTVLFVTSTTVIAYSMLRLIVFLVWAVTDLRIGHGLGPRATVSFDDSMLTKNLRNFVEA